MRNTMKTVWPLASILGVAAIVAFSFRHPGAKRSDSRPLPGRIGEWYAEIIEAQDLEIQAELARKRCKAKDAVVADVIAGRVTLFEAAARFRDLNASNPLAAHWLGYQYRDQPYELSLCRSIIHRVELELHSRASGQVDGTVARLESELTEHLRCHGRVRLLD